MKPWKVQKFFGDVVYDLRNRRLLPIVIVLVAAIVAVPVLISSGSSSSSAPLQPTSGAGGVPPETQNAVIAYTPGIRSYKKRLARLSAKDPFRQQFAQSAAKASQLSSTVATAAVAGSGGSGDASAGVGSTVTGGSGSGSGKPSGSGKQKKKKKSSKTSYSYSVTVMAGEATSTLTPFANVSSLTPLPSQTSPAVIYYGLSTDNRTALFLVSNKVDTVSGPGPCVPAPDDCALLALGAGQSEDLHYTQDDKTYRIVVSEIRRVAK